MRLNLFIAKYTSFSRRQADRLIQSGQVRVGGQVVRKMPVLVTPEKDHVKVKGKLVAVFHRPVYIAFHKPEKTLTTTDDPKKRRTVYHYLSKIRCKLFPVGRLDWNTQGLLLLTNDGLFTEKVLKRKIPKTYIVRLDGEPSLAQIEKLKKGVSIPKGGRVRALHIQKEKNRQVRVVIAEGKNRQLHFMFLKIGFGIKSLKRISIGKLKLGSLKKGEWKQLTTKDLSKIYKEFSFKSKGS